jgi:hypothetical protein
MYVTVYFSFDNNPAVWRVAGGALKWGWLVFDI